MKRNRELVSLEKSLSNSFRLQTIIWQNFWKQKALDRLAGWLKPGGKFHLMDVVFQTENVDANVEAWIAQTAAQGGAEVGDSIRGHVGKEFSTYAWIMAGLLERAGFRIDSADAKGGVLANYWCTKA